MAVPADFDGDSPNGKRPGFIQVPIVCSLASLCTTYMCIDRECMVSRLIVNDDLPKVRRRAP